MRRDDRNDRDPFEDFFEQLERMMNDVMGGEMNVRVGDEGADAHVTVYEDDTELRVVADLPGVEKEAIELKCDGKVLTIETENDATEYDERVRLPTRVDEHTASASYNNGVLEVRLERADSADIDLE